MESRSSPWDKNGVYSFNQGMTEVGRREKNKGWVTKTKDSTKKQNWLWIITCCGEAKLTVLGTSYAICVETPPMSRTPAVLFLSRASCWSLPGTCTSTTASPSSKIDRREMRVRQGGFIVWLLCYYIIIFVVVWKCPQLSFFPSRLVNM